MAVLAKILIYGDIHLNSKNYGGHIDYATESLSYFQKITKIAEENQVTHLVGLGDFTYSRFHTLEYRKKVEEELEKQYKLTGGNRFELKGNHDIASYGMTEYEYYIEKGLIRPSTNLEFPGVNISMIDNDKSEIQKILPVENADVNVVLAHDYFKFKNTKIADYGKAIELDNFVRWFGIDYLICGHIHQQEIFSGDIIKNGVGHEVVVQYPGSPSRPAYRKGHMDAVGLLPLLTITDDPDNRFKYDVIKMDLLPIQESFNIQSIEAKAEKREEKRNRVDISDVVSQLDAHEGAVGNPEDIIMSMTGIADKYKKKAIDLLHSGQA